MGRLVKISFEGNPPTQDQILELMEKRTGLNLCLQKGTFALVLEACEQSTASLDFTIVEIEIDYESKQIEITGLRYRVYYLLGVLVSVLVELGGQHDGINLPRWTMKRWEDVVFKIFVPR